MRPHLTLCIATLVTAAAICSAQAPSGFSNQKEFTKYWTVESESPDYSVSFSDGVAEIKAPKGITVWRKEKLCGNVTIEYDARVMDEGQPGDRLSDLNCFWMATDPAAKDIFKNASKRGGIFANQSALKLYYVGFGGNSNSTTRFRRYDGNPDPAIQKEYTDAGHLLIANRWYHVKLVSNDGKVQYWMDGERLVDWRDSEPLTEGWFGFRSTQSRTQIKNFTYTCTEPETYDAVPLHWIGETPQAETASTFGVPFRQGEVTGKTVLELHAADGSIIPADQWTLAKWPDGSVKWAGVAASIPAGNGTLSIVKTTPKKAPLPAASMVEDLGSALKVSTGEITVIIPKQGQYLLESMERGGVKVGGKADLVLATTEREYTSEVKSVTLEQDGGVRATIKIEGVHAAQGREWLPFIVRAYFYKGSAQMRLVHSFVFDGDQDTDFISSMGLRFRVPFREELYNRHILFGTDDEDVWHESVQPISGRRQLGRGINYTAVQAAFGRVPQRETMDPYAQDLLDNWACWDEYKLTQLTDCAWSIRKRATDDRPWIGTFTGEHADGFAFAGDLSGGLTVLMKDFWQLYPTGVEVKAARSDEASLTVWLWSPEAQPMDLRHYDVRAHDLDASYEDVQEGLSTPYGIAKTHELTIVPEAGIGSKPSSSQLLPTPQYLHDAHAFGIWSMPDRSNAKRAEVEDKLDGLITLYQGEVKKNKWYGMWNYGDFMHTYDTARDSWMYDVGGYAWDNTELATNDWLWYQFLRTGREDIWQMATAMSRHTCEVDVYHIGEMKGLGSRHNVSHWGCGAKEARIGQACWNRFLFYLTADERSGDLCDESKDAEQILYWLDPMRLAAPRELYPSSAPARLRIGPDWLAYAGNWMTRWERTGESHYYDMIVAGMKSIAALPNGILTGKEKVLGFDPATGVLSYEGKPDNIGTNHLMTIMGGFEIMMEMFEMVDVPEFQQAWSYHARHYHELASFRVSRLGAYAAYKEHDPALAEETWNVLMRGSDRMLQVPNTNNAATWSLDAIYMQEVIPQ